MAFGSFDLFHKGHEHYLKEAKSFGDFLTVIVSRDVNIQRLKNHEAMFSEEERIRKKGVGIIGYSGVDCGGRQYK